MDTPRLLYEFGRFRIDPRQGLLLSANGELPLSPKAFDTLRVLVERAGTVVSKDELMNLVWPDTIVDENNLAQNISLVRRTLASADPGAEYVQTVPRRGYRLVVPVSTSDGGRMVPVDSRMLPRPRTEYARSGDVRIAFQVLGDGPVDVIFVMGWVSHLEMFWEEPGFARFLERIAGFSRLILFDKRGTGLSDSVALSRLPTLEERMDDVRAVMDAVGSRRAVLVGVSEGATMCSLFAATHPRNTAGLIMIGGYSRRLRAPDYPWGSTPEAREQFIATIERDWGGPVGIEERAPSRIGDVAFRDWWARYLRMGASPGAAAALTRMNAAIDIRPVLPSIRVPTLILHRVDDRCLNVEEGRYMAERIPDARFLELPGEDHLPFVGDQESVLEPIERFVGEIGGAFERTLVLTNVLSVRMCEPGSPGAALRVIGDTVGAEIAWHRGERIASSDDTILATFDGPARAIRCGAAIVGIGRRNGIALAAGVHTGECDLVHGQLAGIAVGIASSLAAEAAAGEVLVSGTVRDLVAGAGIVLQDLDLLDLGPLGCWQVARVAPVRP